MQTELPKADMPNRKRRWFQFSLRSLMIFTMACAIAAGWESHVIRERATIMNRTKADHWEYVIPAEWNMRKSEIPATVPVVRRWLGDQAIQCIFTPVGASSGDLDAGRSIFPEAEIWEGYF
jgi:hypothetical protein